MRINWSYRRASIYCIAVSLKDKYPTHGQWWCLARAADIFAERHGAWYESSDSHRITVATDATS